jgi:signal transduction histidine kinase
MLRTSDTIYTDMTDSIIAVRLTGDNLLLGVLVFRGSRMFTDDEVKLVTIISSKIEDAIHIARLHQTERKYVRFTMDMAREIRSPLTPLVGYTDLMMMGGAGAITEMQQVFLKNIRDAADRIMILMNGIMNVSRLDSGEALALNTGTVDLKEVLESAYEQCINRPHHSSKNLSTTLTFAEDVPTIEADRGKVVQIVTAVLDNALDYTKPNGRVDVSTSLSDDKQHVCIKVEDTGVGIPPELKDKIWQRFERNEEDVVALGVVGTGLGLTLVRELVHLHHGKAWFESERGKGTTFYIELPVKQAK